MEYQQLDVTISSENTAAEIKSKLVQKLRPTWQLEDTVVQPLHGGYSNVSFTVHLRSGDNQDDRLVVRVSRKLEPMEERVLRALNAKGRGVPLLASFNNGRVFKFIDGKCPTNQQMTEDKLIRQTAAELAFMHATLPLDLDPRGDPLGEAKDIFNGMCKQYDDVARHARYSACIPYNELVSECKSLLEYLPTTNMEAVISHWDLWSANLLFNEEAGTVTLLDFEHAGLGYAPVDVGHCLVEGDNDARLTMAKCYLEERLKLSGDHSHDQTEFEEKLKTFVSQMYKGELLNILILVRHFSCIGNSPEDAEYLDYAIRFWEKYKELKHKYLSLKPEDVSTACSRS